MRLPESLQHPARAVPLAFAIAVSIGTAVLALPVARAGEGAGAPFLVALFTATSAVCVTGLVVVDTPSYWSPFGEGVIAALIQVGGFGIMTLATLFSLLVSRRLGLRSRLVAAQETKALGLGDVARVLRGVALVMLSVEAVVATILTARFALGYDEPFGTALWHGVFHAISSFNNAGFALWPNNLIDFVGDPWVCLPIAVAVVLGGIGFPVLFELRRHLRSPRHWSTHTLLTVWTSLGLLFVGTVALLTLEWTNPDTLGPLNVADKLLASFFQGGVQPRTAGFNSLDYAALNEETLTVQTGLMFVGGGSAGTAGGIKVTTFSLLAFVILAEMRGDHDVTVGYRRIAPGAVRQAVTVALLGVGVVALGTLALMLTTPYHLTPSLFEATSAFATVGLSTGITANIPPAGEVVLIVLMFVGRVGTVTAGSALALRTSRRLYRMPESRPIVG